MSKADDLIRVLSKASDKYGNPYLIGFMDKHRIRGLHQATEEQLSSYIAEVGLGCTHGRKVT